MIQCFIEFMQSALCRSDLHTRLHHLKTRTFCQYYRCNLHNFMSQWGQAISSKKGNWYYPMLSAVRDNHCHAWTMCWKAVLCVCVHHYKSVDFHIPPTQIPWSKLNQPVNPVDSFTGSKSSWSYLCYFISSISDCMNKVAPKIILKKKKKSLRL